MGSVSALQRFLRSAHPGTLPAQTFCSSEDMVLEARLRTSKQSSFEQDVAESSNSVFMSSKRRSPFEQTADLVNIFFMPFREDAGGMA